MRLEKFAFSAQEKRECGPSGPAQTAKISFAGEKGCCKAPAAVRKPPRITWGGPNMLHRLPSG